MTISVVQLTIGQPLFAECNFSSTRQRSSLPNAKKTLGKKNTQQTGSLPSVKKTLGSLFAECFFGTRQRVCLPSVFCFTLGKQEL
jgi:hypothetical protein